MLQEEKEFSSYFCFFFFGCNFELSRSKQGSNKDGNKQIKTIKYHEYSFKGILMQI